MLRRIASHAFVEAVAARRHGLARLRALQPRRSRNARRSERGRRLPPFALRAGHRPDHRQLGRTSRRSRAPPRSAAHDRRLSHGGRTSEDGSAHRGIERGRNLAVSPEMMPPTNGHALPGPARGTCMGESETVAREPTSTALSSTSSHLPAATTKDASPTCTSLAQSRNRALAQGGTRLAGKLCQGSSSRGASPPYPGPGTRQLGLFDPSSITPFGRISRGRNPRPF